MFLAGVELISSNSGNATVALNTYKPLIKYFMLSSENEIV